MIDGQRCRYFLDDGSQCTNGTSSPSSLCDVHFPQHAADLEILKIVSEHLRQDVREFWTRSSFYLVSEIGLFSVSAALLSKESTNGIRIEVLGVASLGFVVAVFWAIVLRGAVLWIRRWRSVLIEIDEKVDRFQAYKRVESYAEASPLMSPSNVSQFLPLVFMAAWIGVLVVAVLRGLP